MTESTQATVAVATPAYAKRAARALIGWLTEDEGALWLAGRNAQAASDVLIHDKCKQARREAATRAPIGAQDNILADLPPSLTAHIGALTANPWGARILQEGGRPYLVDLRRVRAMQPMIHTEDAKKRFATVSPADIASIAALTIPVPPKDPPSLQAIFDHGKQAHIMGSPSPNLRVMAPLSGAQIEIAPGIHAHAFGFAVALLPSLMTVARVNGRYFLLDGYHRAFGMLSAGITYAPALVKEFGQLQEASIPVGMLSPDVYLGDHPPLLPDYLDDAVSADTLAPLVTKMIVIQALEVTPLG